MSETHTSLTARERDVLDAVGQRLTNREIADSMYISIRTVESHIAALRRKLQVESRTALIARALVEMQALLIGLPSNSLVGRDDMVSDIVERLQPSRCVTLLGPPGVGKTRLARTVARASGLEVRVADLAHANPESVAVIVADVLGVGAGPLASIAAHLRTAVRGRRCLLLLDNADGVAASVGRLCADLTSDSSLLTVLVTTTEALAVPTDVVRVDPLGVPTDDSDVESSPAGRMFLDRVRSADPTFEVTEQNAHTLASLCRRLDGLPLALELAAARVASIGLAELDREVGRHLDVLESGGSTHHHRSLSATAEAAWQETSEHLRLVLRVLAVLAAPAGIEEIRTLLLRSGNIDVDVARALLELSSKSLVQPVKTAGQTIRYRVLQTIRYTVDRASAPEHDRVILSGAARWHAELLHEACRSARSGHPGPIGSVGPIADANVLSTLHWAATHDVDAAEAIVLGISQRFELEPTASMLHAVRQATADHGLAAGWGSEELAWAATAINYVDLPMMQLFADAALERAQDERARAFGLYATGFAGGYLDASTEALGRLVAAEEAFHELGELQMVAMSLMGQGLTAADEAEAVAALERSVTAFAVAGDRWHTNSVRLMLARRMMADPSVSDERLATVEVWLADSETFFARPGFGHDRLHVVAAYAELAERRGDVDAAIERAVESAAAFRAHGDLRCLSRAELMVARLSADPNVATMHARRAVAAADLLGSAALTVEALAALALRAESADNGAVAARADGARRRLLGVALTADECNGPFGLARREGFEFGPGAVSDDAGPDMS